MNPSGLFVAVFLACLVEGVEATTIVLAAGVGRDWRSSLLGAAAGVGLLAVVVGALGPAIVAIPLAWLRVVIGSLLLIFGLQWLRKAILRASGYKALHDEDRIYQKSLASARQAPARRGVGVPDAYAFVLSFKGVVLEGLEVVFIVLTFGANQRDVPLAALAAGAAIAVVVVSAIVVRAPLARVPENTVKFVVGVMLCAFGTFWSTEGAHGRWPGSDAALLVLIAAIAAGALGLIAILRQMRGRTEAGARALATEQAT